MKTVTYKGEQCELLWEKGELVQIMYEGYPVYKAKHLIGGLKVSNEARLQGLKDYQAKRKAARKQKRV